MDLHNNSITIDNHKEVFGILFCAGREFTSVAHLRAELLKYGQKYNIVMSTRNSNSKSLYLWCKHAGKFRKGISSVQPNTLSNHHEKRSRKKQTQRTDCGCYIKAKIINSIWTIEDSCGQHNHPIPENPTCYSFYRRQGEDVKTLILELLNQGQKIGHVLDYLKMIGIHNIIKKDIENLQQQFRRKNKLTILAVKKNNAKEGDLIINGQKSLASVSIPHQTLLFYSDASSFSDTMTMTSSNSDTSSDVSVPFGNHRQLVLTSKTITRHTIQEQDSAEIVRSIGIANGFV